MKELLFIFPEEIKKELKKPLGKLINKNEKLISEIKENINKNNLIIIVGDYTSRILYEKGIYANLYIVDSKIERKPIEKFIINSYIKIYAYNQAGTISSSAINAIKKAFKLISKEDKKVTIYIDGEEDLLTLLAIKFAPKNSVIIYGQPNEGSVIIEATNERKKFINKFFKKAIKE
ncbi:MAG: DUF359 domain-containing protein [Nitrososphaerota archaeon]